MMRLRAGGRVGASVLAAAAAILLLPALGGASDWPHYMGPNRDGISTESPVWPADTAAFLASEDWRASVGQGYSQVAVSNGRVYTMGYAGGQDTVYCFDEASIGDNPEPLWTWSYDCGSGGSYIGPRATPTVDVAGGKLYTFSLDGDLYCFSTADSPPQRVLWSKDVKTEIGASSPTWHFSGSPLVEGQLVILNLGSYGAAFDKDTGDMEWSTGTAAAGYATPVPYGSGADRLVVIFAGNEVVGVDPADGDRIWYCPWDNTCHVNAADPIIHDGRVFVSSDYGKGCGVLQPGTGQLTPVWSNTNLRNHANCSVLWEGYVYGIDQGGSLRCVDFEDGQNATGGAEWSQGGFGGKCGLMIAGGDLVVLSESGNLFIVNPTPSGYDQLHSADVLDGTCWTAPVLANGKLYVRNQGGTLVCYDVSGGSTVSITVDTNPTGLEFTVDGGAPQTAPQVFNWTPTDDHTLSVASPQESGGTRSTFTSWSDGGAQSHTYTVPSEGETVTASFISTHYQLTTAVDPGGSGSVTPANGSWHNAGSTPSVEATANLGYLFDQWSGDLTGAGNPQDLTMSAPRSVTAHFVENLIDITVDTSPSGRQITVDGGAAQTAPQTFNWAEGSSHTLSVASPQGSSGTRYVFSSWDDGDTPGSATTNYTVPSADDTVTASFTTQHQLATAVDPGGSGSVTPADGSWHDAGSTPSVLATPSALWEFASWSGDDINGSTTNPETLTMNGPKSVTAHFNSTVSWVDITVATDPSGLDVDVDGTVYTASEVFNWQVTSVHTLTAPSPQSGGAGTRYVFDQWDKGDTPLLPTTDYTVPGIDDTVTASYVTEYRFTWSAVPAGRGTVTPASGSWHEGGGISVEAAPVQYWEFDHWEGDLGGSINPENLTMDGAKSVTAHFVELDSDGDGLPDWWEVQYDLDPNLEDSDGDGITDDNENEDGDGYTNLQEYQNGTDPTVSNSSGGGVGISCAAGRDGAEGGASALALVALVMIAFRGLSGARPKTSPGTARSRP